MIYAILALLLPLEIYDEEMPLTDDDVAVPLLESPADLRCWLSQKA